MSNHYSQNQWDQSQFYNQQPQQPLGGQQLNFGQFPQQQQRSTQQQQQSSVPQQLPPYQNQFPFNTSPGPSPGSSSLQGALQNNPSQHSRTSSWNNISPQVSPTYGSQGVGQQQAYPSNTQFHFGQGSTGLGGYTATSPDPLQSFPGDGLGSSIGSNLPGPSASKRQRPTTSLDDTDYQLPEQGAQGDSKDDQKAKPIRACARCKSLKVRCEVKNEGDPCKRCINGGHDCIIPGRKIRRVPPKREHLINKIKEQSEAIERLMRQLETATSMKQEETNPSLVSSPALSASTKSLFDETQARQQEGPADAGTKKAIEDWIAKTRENMQELDSFILSDASVPESYILEEDPEDPPSSDDEEYSDPPEHPNGFGHGDDRVGWAVEDHNGQISQRQDGRPSQRIRHRSSASSMGTTRSANAGKKKNGGDPDRPANLPVPAAPFGLFGSMVLQSSEHGENDEVDDTGAGIANEQFFRPSAPEALVRQRTPISAPQVPPILASGLITPADAEKLFQIYYSEINLSVSLLDPVLYDAQRTFWRSPFLFTVICAIASRFYPERSNIYPQAMQCAQQAAGNALVSGTKNVEMCAGFILMSLYPMPVKRWEQQRSWLYLGLAIRVATDLNLHLPITAKPKNENHAREMLNRTRIWLNCFNLDRSTGSQYGKPPIISNNDYTANHSENWWQSSPSLNMDQFDIHTCAYNAELRHMSKFIAEIYSDPHHPTGLNKEVDFEAIATRTDDELQKLEKHWFSILATRGNSNPQARFRTGLLRLAYSYARLIALSYGFQHAFGKNDGLDENPFLQRCLSAASDVVRVVVDDICIPQQQHWWRHGPDAQSVFVTFASAFLIKLLQPKFASYLTRDKRIEIRSLVQKVIDLLASPAIAIDDRHGPKLYSKFLKNLLAKPLAQIDPPSTRGQSEPAPPRKPTKITKSTSSGEQMGTSNLPNSADPYQTVFNHSSPGTSGSLSPPPAEAIADFNNFRPVGGVDPYAPDEPVMNAFGAGVGGAGGNADMFMMDYFQPELPFDPEIIRSFHDLNDPRGWQDIQMPAGFNLMTQVQQNLGIAGDFQSVNNQFNADMYLTGSH